jgi:hypothetical protein
MQGNKTFDDRAIEYRVCIEFAASDRRSNLRTIIKFGEVRDNKHAWVYDTERDWMLDATLSQWNGFTGGRECDDWWCGDDHPIVEKPNKFDSAEAFTKGTGGNSLREAK